MIHHNLIRNPVDDTFDRAMKHRDAGEHKEALRLLQELVEDRVDRRWRLVGVHCQIGNIYTYYLDKPELGERAFRNAVKLKPSSELSSLGLFHSLARQQRLIEALDEMKRFLTKYRSAEYSRLLEDMKRSRTR